MIEEHEQDEIKLINPKCVLMEDEIGEVVVRIFKRGENLTCRSWAYMGRVLDESEKRLMLKLWNETEEFLHQRVADNRSEEYKNNPRKEN